MKCTQVQTEREETLQLQANMLLLTSALLHSKVKAGEESINITTSYRVLMGHEYPLKVGLRQLGEHKLEHNQLVRASSIMRA